MAVGGSGLVFFFVMKPDLDNPRAEIFDSLAIRLTRRCACACAHCRLAPLKDLPEPGRDDLVRALSYARKSGMKRVIFTGGEPLASPHLPAMVALASRLDMSVELRTTGIGLEAPGVLEKLVRLGLSHLRVDLHGPDAATHEKVCGVDSFAVAWKTLERAVSLNLSREVHAVVVNANLKTLPNLPERLKTLAPIRLSVAAVDPSAMEEKAFDAVVPSLGETSQVFEKIYQTWISLPDSERGELRFSGLPLCLLPDDESTWHETRKDGWAERYEPPLEGFSRTRYLDRIKTPLCDDCNLFGDCLGVFERLASSAKDLRPRLEPKANAMAFSPVETIDDFDIATCPIRRGVRTVFDPERSLLIEHDGAVKLFRTDTGDFSSERIRATRLETRQVYLDVSDKLFHDDFSNDLRKLELSPSCENCSNLLKCAGFWTPVEKDVFSLAEEELAEVLSRIDGDVLDVGAGSLLYGERFGERLDAETMRYTALEPTPGETLRRFVENHASASLIVGDIESAALKKERFDWILVLRSYNHFHSLPRAFDAFEKALKPGGKLLVVDNTAWGVVYDEDKWSSIRGQKGKKHFEHYRNHDSEQALASIIAINSDSLRLLQHHPVSKHGANQWWLLFEKLA